MKLSEKIKQLRNNAGLTQPELAAKANVEQSYLSKLENDKGSPSFDVIAKIAAAFDMDVMDFIDSLDISFLHENLAHLPEIAVKLEQRKLARKSKQKRSFIASAWLIIIGITCVILGQSNSIFSEKIYQYKSMGFIQKAEVNNHYKAHPLSEIGENWEQANKRIADNIARINEELVLTRSYQGENYSEYYGAKRRNFELIDERIMESPWKDAFVILGMMLLTCGGFGLAYTFKFINQ